MRAGLPRNAWKLVCTAAGFGGCTTTVSSACAGSEASTIAAPRKMPSETRIDRNGATCEAAGQESVRPRTSVADHGYSARDDVEVRPAARAAAGDRRDLARGVD